MSDWFDKANNIRKGLMDDEIPPFQEMKMWFTRVPDTHLPALLKQVVTCCVAQNIFKSDEAMMENIKRWSDNVKNPMSVLRDDGAPKEACDEDAFELNKHYAAILRGHFGWISCYATKDGCVFRSKDDIRHEMSAADLREVAELITQYVGRRDVE